MYELCCFLDIELSFTCVLHVSFLSDDLFLNILFLDYIFLLWRFSFAVQQYLSFLSSVFFDLFSETLIYGMFIRIAAFPPN